MGWLPLVGSLKLYVSFAEYCLFHRALLRKRPTILRSLLIVTAQYVGGQDLQQYLLWSILWSINIIGDQHQCIDSFNITECILFDKHILTTHVKRLTDV